MCSDSSAHVCTHSESTSYSSSISHMGTVSDFWDSSIWWSGPESDFIHVWMVVPKTGFTSLWRGNGHPNSSHTSRRIFLDLHPGNRSRLSLKHGNSWSSIVHTGASGAQETTPCIAVPPSQVFVTNFYSSSSSTIFEVSTS